MRKSSRILNFWKILKRLKPVVRLLWKLINSRSKRNLWRKFKNRRKLRKNHHHLILKWRKNRVHCQVKYQQKNKDLQKKQKRRLKQLNRRLMRNHPQQLSLNKNIQKTKYSKISVSNKKNLIKINQLWKKATTIVWNSPIRT